jgi:hypothetical protein
MALCEEILVTCDAPTVTGTTTIDSTPVDMAGFTGVIFLVRVGTAAANVNIRAQQDTVVGMGTAADLLGTLVATGSNTTVALDVVRTQEQFVRCRVTRGTTTTIDSMVTIRYGARRRPTAWPATQTLEVYGTGPIEGTA